MSANRRWRAVWTLRGVEWTEKITANVRRRGAEARVYLRVLICVAYFPLKVQLPRPERQKAYLSVAFEEIENRK